MFVSGRDGKIDVWVMRIPVETRWNHSCKTIMPPVCVYLCIVESSRVFTGGCPNIGRLGVLNVVSQMVILGVGQLADHLFLRT